MVVKRVTHRQFAYNSAYCFSRTVRGWIRFELQFLIEPNENHEIEYRKRSNPRPPGKSSRRRGFHARRKKGLVAEPPVSINVAGLFPDISCCRAKIYLPRGGWVSIDRVPESRKLRAVEREREGQPRDTAGKRERGWSSAPLFTLVTVAGNAAAG